MSTTAMSEHERIYLDHAAATPLSPSAREAMQSAQGLYGNPSSLHGEGRAAAQSLHKSRAAIAGVLGAEPGEIIFTGSGSEADALAVMGAARAQRARGNHIVVSAIEHKAVLKSAALLKKDGFEISYLKPDAHGRVTPEALALCLQPSTTLVSVMYANNEIGTVEPVRELAALVHEKSQALFHTDACQAAGALPLNARELGVDFMTLNAAKVYGPKGIGALFVRRGIALESIVPGEQERGVRGGTEGVVLAAGFAAALLEAEVLKQSEAPRLAALRDLLIREIMHRVPDATLNGHLTQRLPNNVHVSVPHIEGESMLLMLDAAGIAAATGSACNSLDLAPSHVLLATQGDAALAHGSVRFTLGRSTTRAQVLRTAEEFSRVARLLKEISPLGSRLLL
jgi:cysteine desulfurase